MYGTLGDGPWGCGWATGHPLVRLGMAWAAGDEQGAPVGNEKVEEAVQWTKGNWAEGDVEGVEAAMHHLGFRCFGGWGRQGMRPRCVLQRCLVMLIKHAAIWVLV